LNASGKKKKKKKKKKGNRRDLKNSLLAARIETGMEMETPSPLTKFTLGYDVTSSPSHSLLQFPTEYCQAQPSPSLAGAELALFSYNPTTPPTPPTRESLVWTKLAFNLGKNNSANQPTDAIASHKLVLVDSLAS